MKRIGLVCIAAMAASMIAAQDKIVVVNMVDLVRFHPSSERDRKLMQDTEKDFQSRLDKQRDRFEELRNEYEKAVKEARTSREICSSRECGLRL